MGREGVASDDPETGGADICAVNSPAAQLEMW